ncbi:MAG: FAD binding domain-containing protein [Actinomycetota bacterium]
MKPAPFTYHRPVTRDEVDALLAALGGDAKLLAGGQSLIPILNMRLAAPGHVIDLNHLGDEPSEPWLDGGHVCVGPIVRQSATERSDLVAERVPLLAETLDFVAHPAIRNRGTVAGSIAHADPAAELPSVLAVLGGHVVARSSAGRRTIRAGDCFAGPLENSLDDTEWVEEVRWPTAEPNQGFAFAEFARRSGDYALCGVAARAERASDGTTMIALGYLGMGDVPVCIDLAPLETSALEGAELEDAIRQLVEDRLDPVDDIHATVAFRRHLARKLGVNAARRAWTRASTSHAQGAAR